MRIFSPTIMLRGVSGITPDMLEKLDVKALILDIDNTLAAHNGPMPEAGVQEWIDEIKSAGIKLVLLSNNREKRVLPFAKELGLEYTANAMKPLTKGFKKTAKKLGLKPKNIAVVGDQVFTDILGGSLFGAVTILVRPMREEEGWFFRFKRSVERRLLNGRKYM